MHSHSSYASLVLYTVSYINWQIKIQDSENGTTFSATTFSIIFLFIKNCFILRPLIFHTMYIFQFCWVPYVPFQQSSNVERRNTIDVSDMQTHLLLVCSWKDSVFKCLIYFLNCQVEFYIFGTSTLNGLSLNVSNSDTVVTIFKVKLCLPHWKIILTFFSQILQIVHPFLNLYI